MLVLLVLGQGAQRSTRVRTLRAAIAKILVDRPDMLLQGPFTLCLKIALVAQESKQKRSFTG